MVLTFRSMCVAKKVHTYVSDIHKEAKITLHNDTIKEIKRCITEVLIGKPENKLHGNFWLFGYCRYSRTQTEASKIYTCIAKIQI